MPRLMTTTMVVSLTILAGCGSDKKAAVSRASSYGALAKGDGAYNAKKYADAIPAFDEAIKEGGVQADVLAETYLKRAVCKIETGDLAGAESDLSMAEQGGAVGEDFQAAQKRLKEKKSGS